MHVKYSILSTVFDTQQLTKLKLGHYYVYPFDDDDDDDDK